MMAFLVQVTAWLMDYIVTFHDIQASFQAEVIKIEIEDEDDANSYKYEGIEQNEDKIEPEDPEVHLCFNSWRKVSQLMK